MIWEIFSKSSADQTLTHFYFIPSTCLYVKPFITSTTTQTSCIEIYTFATKDIAGADARATCRSRPHWQHLTRYISRRNCAPARQFNARNYSTFLGQRPSGGGNRKAKLAPITLTLCHRPKYCTNQARTHANTRSRCVENYAVSFSLRLRCYVHVNINIACSPVHAEWVTSGFPPMPTFGAAIWKRFIVSAACVRVSARVRTYIVGQFE